MRGIPREIEAAPEMRREVLRLRVFAETNLRRHLRLAKAERAAALFPARVVEIGARPGRIRLRSVVEIPPFRLRAALDQRDGRRAFHLRPDCRNRQPERGAVGGQVDVRSAEDQRKYEPRQVHECGVSAWNSSERVPISVSR